MNTGEQRLYVENYFSQRMILFWLAGNTIYTLLYVNNVTVSVQMGFFVMLNIALSLFAFLIAVRQRVYLVQWAYAGIGLAVFQFLRLLWVPEELVNPMRLYVQALLVATAVAALIGSIICIQRSRERQQYIDDNNINPVIMQK